jgi:hypothetical protein
MSISSGRLATFKDLQVSLILSYRCLNNLGSTFISKQCKFEAKPPSKSTVGSFRGVGLRAKGFS